MLKTEPEANGEFNIRAFGRDVLVYSVGQGALLFLGFVQGIIIPKNLSPESYGYFQLFMLYTGYIGILHFGLLQGVLLKWAGKELTQVGKEIGVGFRLLVFQQLVTIIPLYLILRFVLKLGQPFEWIVLIALVYAFIYNVNTFFQFTARAVKKFQRVALVNLGVQLAFLAMVICLLSFGYLRYSYVIYVYLIANTLGLIALALLFRKYLGGLGYSFTGFLSYGKELLSIGILVYLGDIATALLLAVDRLTVSLFFPIGQFAIYAFALVVASVAYTFVAAVSQVFFPYLSGATPELRARAYHLGKPAIILAWAGILAIYFPATWLIQLYLPQYVAGLPIMQIMLCTVGFGSLVQILHLSYYMSYRKQRQYLLSGITALALSVLLNLLAIKVFGSLEIVAIATLISFAIWSIVNELTLKSVVGAGRQELWRGVIIIFCYMGAFWLASSLSQWFVAQMLIYIGFFCLISWLLLGSEAKELAHIANELRNRRR